MIREVHQWNWKGDRVCKGDHTVYDPCQYEQATPEDLIARRGGKLSIRIYVSHTDPVHGLLAARRIMEVGGYPFVPQLNKLITGRTDEEWVKYYKMWALQCEVMLLTESYRPHEAEFARENRIFTASTVQDAMMIKLPPFAELGRRFGEEVAEGIVNEGWRNLSVEEANKQLDNVAGIGAHSDPLHIARLALFSWDRQKQG